MARTWPAAAAETISTPDVQIPYRSCFGKLLANNRAQIETAEHLGFRGIEVDFNALATGHGIKQEFERVLQIASEALETGQSPILYTAKGKTTEQVTGP